MVRVWDIADGHVVVRHPSGAVRLDTRTPMPVRLGAKSWSGSFGFTNPGGSKLEFSTSRGDYKLTVPAVLQSTQSIDMGAYPASLPAAKWWYGEVRLRQTKKLDVGGDGKYLVALLGRAQNVWSEWVAWPGGSLVLEIGFDDNDPIWLWRHMHVAVVNGRWQLQVRHSNAFFQSNWSRVVPSLVSTYQIDVNLDYGTYK